MNRKSGGRCVSIAEKLYSGFLEHSIPKTLGKVLLIPQERMLQLSSRFHVAESNRAR